MSVLVDINHPAHVHLFKHFIWEIEKLGYESIVTVKKIPSAIALLQHYGIPYIDLGKKRDSLGGKLLDTLRNDYHLLKIVQEKNIRVAVGSSISIAHVSRLTSMTSLVFDDDDAAVQPLFSRFAHPFADYIVTPDALSSEKYGDKHIRYPGYHELAYLHPRRFKPDPTVLDMLSLTKNEPFFVLRFNAFKAHHDLREGGLPIEIKRKLIEILLKYGKVFITTERDIDREFEQFRLEMPPEKIHSLLYFASLFIGDSQTMTTEAALLGTPSLKCNSFAGRLAIPNELERRYKLCKSFTPTQGLALVEEVRSLLQKSDLKGVMQNRLRHLYRDKSDVTSFMVDLVTSFLEGEGPQEPQEVVVVDDNLFARQLGE